MLNIIIFSRNRACQLDLLLRSMKKFWPESFQHHIIVIWMSTEENYKKSYEIVLQEHPDVIFVLQETGMFKQLVEASTDICKPYTMFLVDDIVFKEPFTMDCPEVRAFLKDEQILCVSLRLCPRITYCYTRDLPNIPPEFEPGDLKIWNWWGASNDFGYAMSVDGNIYRTSDIMNIIKNGSYDHPGSFENALLTDIPGRPKMICFEESKLFNIPINRVGPYPNRHGNISAEELNESFLSGKRINLGPLEGYKNIGCHEEVSLQWI